MLSQEEFSSHNFFLSHINDCIEPMVIFFHMAKLYSATYNIFLWCKFSWDGQKKFVYSENFQLHSSIYRYYENSLCLLRSAGTTKVVKIDVEPLVDGIVDSVVLLTDLLQTDKRYINAI